MIRRLDHIAVAVADTDAALEYFRDRLGLEVVAVDLPPEVPVKLTYLDLGNTYLQLVEPLDPDHPVAAWLAANGDGLHHICLGVDDVHAAELARLAPAGRATAADGERTRADRPASWPGAPPHGVRIECTTFRRPEDAENVAGFLGPRVDAEPRSTTRRALRLTGERSRQWPSLGRCSARKTFTENPHSYVCYLCVFTGGVPIERLRPEGVEGHCAQRSKQTTSR